MALASAAWAAACAPAAAAHIWRMLDGDARGAALIGVEGELRYGDEKQFAQLALVEPTAIVVFNSPGGNMVAGTEIGKAIRIKGFATVVLGGATCASACGLAWLGGAPRFAAPDARIGFHAAYLDNGGTPVSNGAANALVGAYLNTIGLSSNAIVYLTSAEPAGMTWMNADDARTHGIEVKPYDGPSLPDASPVPQPPPGFVLTPPTSPEVTQAVTRPPPVNLPSAAPPPGSPSELQARAAAFVGLHLAIWSKPPQSSLAYLAAVYDDSVVYYDQRMSRSEVLDDQGTFLLKWPERDYRLRPTTVQIECAEAAGECTARFVVDWLATNASRDAVSVGTANWFMRLANRGGQIRIIEENSEIVSRIRGRPPQPGAGAGDFSPDDAAVAVASARLAEASCALTVPLGLLDQGLARRGYQLMDFRPNAQWGGLVAAKLDKAADRVRSLSKFAGCNELKNTVIASFPQLFGTF